MDSAPVDNPERSSSSVTSPARDTRALSASLVELRDSLSVRVNQLAVAVERLRARAGDLERSLGQQSASERTRRFSGDLQIPERRPETQPQPRFDDMPSQPITTTSAIATQISQLDRPITSEEIIRLLDRASASLSSAPDLRLAEMEGTLDGLREVRDSLRAGAVDLAGMGQAQDTLRERVRQARQQHSTRSNRPRVGETMHQEAERRLREIAVERQAGKQSRKTKERRGKVQHRVKSAPAARPGLAPTNARIEYQPAIIQSLGVTPPPARKIATPPLPASSVNHRPSISHLEPAALEDLHAELAALDLTLEPTEYMHGLTQILQRAMPDVPLDQFYSMNDIENPAADWDPPDSPSSVSSGLTATAQETIANDTGLTFRGMDVERRTAANAGNAPMTREDRVRRIRNRVASMTGDYSAVAADVQRERAGDTGSNGPDRAARHVLSHRSDQSRRAQEVQIRRAQEIVRDAPRSTQSVQTIARSARELVQAATQPTETPRPSEHGVTYELTAQTELRAAQASRNRAFSRYQQILSSRARREARPVPIATRVEFRTVSGVVVELQAEVPGADLEEQEARQELVSAQMRESRAQQRLNWARSRLRRDDTDDSRARPEISQRSSEDRDRREHAAMWRALSVPRDVGPESASTVGPRNERPEDVDSLVRIRQLRPEGPRTAERIEARRQHLASIRQDLNETRQRINQAGGTSDIVASEQDDTLRRLLSDAQQVNDARRILLDALESDVTPSSPVTAQGRGNYEHIQISVGTDTATHSDHEEVEVQEAEEDRGGRDTEGEDVVLRALRGDGAEEGPQETKETLQATSAPLNPDEASIEADLWPAATRPKRRERVYISMLDL